LPTSRGLDFEFPVSKELRESKARIHTIGIDGDDFVIDFIDQNNEVKRIKSHVSGDRQYDIKTVRDIVESKLAFFFDDVTAKYLTDKLADVIDKLYTTKTGAYAISKIKKYAAAEDAKLDGQVNRGDSNGNGKLKEKPVYPVRKYTSNNGIYLNEAVIIDGQPLFAQVINGGNGVTFYKEIETKDMTLRPPGKLEYPPDSAYEFESEDELEAYIQYSKEKETIYTLYRDVRKFYTRDYFVDTEPRNSTLLALYTITSYFQDKFSTVHYILNVGDNGSGKNSIIITYSWLGHRVFYINGASGANIREYLGTLEEGQGTIAEDEMDNIDKDPEKMKTFKTGYASGGCVPKILEANTKGREQRYYHTYCQKMFASENLPSMKDSRGLLDRSFVVKCIKGFPLKNAKSTKKRTRTDEVLSLISELQRLRKRLFAYRLVHFDDVIQEIHELSISGRALELVEPALLLFHKYKVTEQDDKIFNDEILPTLSSFLNERMNRRNDSIEGKLYPIITKLVEEQGETLENDKIFNTVQVEMEGKEIPGKSDAFYIEDLGKVVTRNNILKILKEKFKAVPTRKVLEDGTMPRAHHISRDALERVKAAYEDPWEIKIGSIDGSSCQVCQDCQVLDDSEEQKTAAGKIRERQDQQEEKEENMHKQQPINDVKTDQNDASSENNQRSSVSYHIEPGNGGKGGKNDLLVVRDAIRKAMLEPQGTTNKGYFTHLDLAFWLMTLPNEYWTEDSTKKLIEEWLQDGKLVEIERGKYKPVTTT
jgi:hypothetical protein